MPSEAGRKSEPSAPARARPIAAAFPTGTGARVRILFEDVVAELDALIANVDARPSDELADLRLVLSAEGAPCMAAAFLALVHEPSIGPSERVSWVACD